ncbi:hypothetical protein BGZ63DRAFT_259641 [Mariannaea sp. PMI_226]|nr:hypothetical protein BGZ63DRAFT_259641 [Mariannaea sp. PMI_226]
MVTGPWDREIRSQHRYHHYPTERFGSDGLESRYLEAYERRQPQIRPMNIGDALRQYCGVNAKRYFVAVILEDGRPACFSGPEGTLGPELIRNFFDEDRYKRVADLLDTGETPENIKLSDYIGSGSVHRQTVDYPRSRVVDRRRMSNFEEWDTPGRSVRKRLRGQQSAADDIPTARTVHRRGIKVENSQELWEFYEQRFKNCQQTACKLIAKAWVKAVEPKKQSTHPYTGSDERAPDWWPKPWGPTKEDKVRHKEPDHLYKRERVYLLNHILNMVIEPKHAQHPDIQKLNLSVKKLEEITLDALSGFFADKENPSNNRKKPYLTEIFKVARQQERFKNDEIDGTAEIFVLAEDRILETYVDETDASPAAKGGDDLDIPASKRQSPHGLVPSTTHDHPPDASLHNASLLENELPLRGTQFPPPMMPEMGPDQHGFGEGTGLSVNNQPSVHPTSANLALEVDVDASHNPSRRPSIFTPPADSSGLGGTGLYAQQWQSATTGPNTSPSLYSFTPQHADPSSTFVNPVVQINQTQPYIGTTFDGLSRGYEAPEASMFRTGSVPQQPAHTSSGYEYVTHDSRELSEAKTDPASRNPMH